MGLNTMKARRIKEITAPVKNPLGEIIYELIGKQIIWVQAESIVSRTL